MPSIFLEEGVSKMDRVELSILAYTNLIMRVDVLVYTGLFSNYLAMFLNTSSVIIVEPNRANLGTNKIYAIMLDGESVANIPVNIPVYGDGNTYPEFSISYAHTQGKPMFRNPLIPNDNVFNPNSVFWNDHSFVPFFYLPFFSNCQSYGKNIPIFSIFEQHKNC